MRLRRKLNKKSIVIGGVLIISVSILGTFKVVSAANVSEDRMLREYVANNYPEYYKKIVESSNSAKNTLSNSESKKNMNVDYLWPVPTKKNVTSGFGKRYLRGKYVNHIGIDIGGEGKEGHEIIAVEEGEVVFSGRYAKGDAVSYGNVVRIKHPDGNETVYAHNRKNLVKVGEKVEKGQVIAEMGNTGNSTGPHLHFEIRVNRKCIDPLQLLPDYKQNPSEVLYKVKVSDSVTDLLNIRRTISYTNDYNIIESLPSGTELEVLREDTHPRALDKSISLLVRTPSGKIGYCKKSYVVKS